MNWLTEILTNPNLFTHNLLVFTVVISIGLFLGRIRIKGISFGATCVLFVGLLVNYLGIDVDHSTLTFMKNFGLVLFVFFIGLQVGPSFFATFKSGGLPLNGLMIAVVLMDLLITVGVFFLFDSSISFEQMLGVMFGAVTSTPGLGATQEALSQIGSKVDITVGYACAYPFAILGMMGVILFLKKLFKVDLDQEDAAWEARQKARQTAPIYFHIDMKNKSLDGLTLRKIRELINRPFICSRVQHNGEILSPTANNQIFCGDTIRVVTNPENKQAIVAFCGDENLNIDLASKHSPLVSRSILISDPKMNGMLIEDLHLSHFDGVNITRVTRAGVTFFPYNSLRMQLGDTLIVVGPENAVRRLAAVMGNEARQLEKPNVMAIFLGIAAGLLLGSMPLMIPGMSTPIQLGVAGGSLIAAILLGYFGPRFHLVTYTTNSANLMLREWGQTFFLSAIGLGAGKQFFEAFIQGPGFLYVALGLPITLIPLLVIGIFARKVMKYNFHTITGLIAGCATNTALLGFVSGLSRNSTAVVSYSSIYPFAMFLRILSGQFLIMLLWSVVH